MDPEDKIVEHETKQAINFVSNYDANGSDIDGCDADVIDYDKADSAPLPEVHPEDDTSELQPQTVTALIANTVVNYNVFGTCDTVDFEDDETQVMTPPAVNPNEKSRKQRGKETSQSSFELSFIVSDTREDSERLSGDV